MNIVQDNVILIEGIQKGQGNNSAENPLNIGVSGEFSEGQYCLPKNEPNPTLNTEFSVPDVPIKELQKMFQKEYNSFRNMKYDRCDHGDYNYSPDIGNFRGFLEAFGPKPDPSYTLERRDPNCSLYSPATAYWADKQTQAENKTNTRYFTDNNGVRLSASQWSRDTGIARKTIIHRVDVLGWSEHEAVHTPKGARRSRRSNRGSVASNEKRFYQVLKWFPHNVDRNTDLCRKVMRQYHMEFPEDFQPDETGYVPEYSVLLGKAAMLFNRQLWSEYRPVKDDNGVLNPDTPALDYLS